VNYISLFISVLLGWLVVSTPKLVSAQTSQGIYFQVRFKKQGGIFLNYFNKNYRNSVINIINGKDGDTTIVKYIETDKPIIFSSVCSYMNNNISYQFIVSVRLTHIADNKLMV
jgi:hypothetical protein